MTKKKRKRLPKIKVWSGTVAHASWDTQLHLGLARLLRLDGFNAVYRGDWSIEQLTDKKTALVTHEARGAWRYVLTTSQTDAEALIFDMHMGKLPKGIKLYNTAHRHTTQGTTKVKGIQVIRNPGFTSFIPYRGSLRMLPHYQPDVGAWFILISKDGRISRQEWLYPPFIYHDIDNKVFMADVDSLEKGYVNPAVKTVNKPLSASIRNSKKVIMSVSDLHVGEKYSVAPPTYTFPLKVEKEKGEPILYQTAFTEANKKLYKYWRHLVYMAMKVFKVDEVWLVGDAVAGSGVFEKSRAPIISTLDHQMYACVELFRAFKEV